VSKDILFVTEIYYVYNSIVYYTQKEKQMRTNIAIDDKLMNAALKTSGLLTKKDVVEEALKLLVQVKKQSRLKKLRGKLKWEGDLEEMRTKK
jgi:Arc/MetJ family transcription regulator